MLLRFENHKDGIASSRIGRKKKFDLKSEEGWHNLKRLLVGEIGVNNYNELTFVDVMQIIEGYNDRIVQGYKQTRLLMFTMARLLGDSKKVPSTVEEFWTLPGDEVAAKTSEEEMKAIFDNLKKAKNE